MHMTETLSAESDAEASLATVATFPVVVGTAQIVAALGVVRS